MPELDDYVSTDPEVLAGLPVFKGTRVSVRTLFDYLLDSSLDDFMEGFPAVTRKQAEATIEMAAAKMFSEIATDIAHK